MTSHDKERVRVGDSGSCEDTLLVSNLNNRKTPTNLSFNQLKQMNYVTNFDRVATNILPKYIPIIGGRTGYSIECFSTLLGHS